MNRNKIIFSMFFAFFIATEGYAQEKQVSQREFIIAALQSSEKPISYTGYPVDGDKVRHDLPGTRLRLEYPDIYVGDSMSFRIQKLSVMQRDAYKENFIFDVAPNAYGVEQFVVCKYTAYDLVLMALMSEKKKSYYAFSGNKVLVTYLK